MGTFVLIMEGNYTHKKNGTLKFSTKKVIISVRFDFMCDRPYSFGIHLTGPLVLDYWNVSFITGCGFHT